VAQIVFDLHKALAGHLVKVLEASKGRHAKMMRFYGSVSEMLALIAISKLSEKDRRHHDARALKRVILALEKMRRKGEGSSSRAAVIALSELAAFYRTKPPSVDPDLEPVFGAVTRKKIGKVGEALKRLLQVHRALVPNQFDALRGIRDTGTICDLVYDKAESFDQGLQRIVAGDQSETEIEGELDAMPPGHRRRRDSHGPRPLSDGDVVG